MTIARRPDCRKCCLSHCGRFWAITSLLALRESAKLFSGVIDWRSPKQMNSLPGKRKQPVRRFFSVVQLRMRRCKCCSCLPIKDENDCALPKRQASGVSTTEALACRKKFRIESHSTTILFLAFQEGTKAIALRIHKTTSRKIYVDRYRPYQVRTARCYSVNLP